MKNATCHTPAFEKNAHEIFKHSEKTLRKVKRHLDDNSFEGALSRGNLFELVGHFDDAIDSYKQAIRHNEKSTLAKARLALSQIKSGLMADALETATDIAKADPFFDVPALSSSDEIPVLTILGDALAVNNRFDEALKTYSKVAEKGSADPYTLGRLAQLYIVTGQEEKAIKLADDISSSVRFTGLSNILLTKNIDIAKVSGLNKDSLAGAIMLDDHGRPFVSEGEIKSAKMADCDTGWCSGE